MKKLILILLFYPFHIFGQVSPIIRPFNPGTSHTSSVDLVARDSLEVFKARIGAATYPTSGIGYSNGLTWLPSLSTSGIGSIVALTNSPFFVTPQLGAASATSINKLTITAPATSATLTVANGKTFTSNNTLTLSGNDNSTLNVGSGGTLGTLSFISAPGGTVNFLRSDGTFTPPVDTVLKVATKTDINNLVTRLTEEGFDLTKTDFVSYKIKLDKVTGRDYSYYYLTSDNTTITIDSTNIKEYGFSVVNIMGNSRYKPSFASNLTNEGSATYDSSKVNTIVFKRVLGKNYYKIYKKTINTDVSWDWNNSIIPYCPYISTGSEYFINSSINGIIPRADIEYGSNTAMAFDNTIVKTAGTRSVKFILNPTTPSTTVSGGTSAGNFRSEITLTPWHRKLPVKTEYWLKWSYYFPNYVLDPGSALSIFQAHEGNGAPPIAIYNSPSQPGGDFGSLIMKVSRGATVADDLNRYVYTGFHIPANQWVDFVLHVIWDTESGAQGLVQLWINGTKYNDVVGGNIFTNNPADIPNIPYAGTPKFGLYKSDWRTAGNITTSVNAGVTSTTVLLSPVRWIIRQQGEWLGAAGYNLINNL